MNDPSQEPPRNDTPPRIARTSRNSSDFERSLAELSDARRGVSAEEHREEWAELTFELAHMYSVRKLGAKSENLNVAIQCYDEALTVYEPQCHPKEWILCHSNLGRAYLGLSDGRDRLLKEISFAHYQAALALISKESWPELWHRVQLELAVLFRKYMQSPHDEDARLSDEHYQLAFDLDRDQRPELYDSMRKTYDLHLRLFELQAELESVRKERTCIVEE